MKKVKTEKVTFDKPVPPIKGDDLSIVIRAIVAAVGNRHQRVDTERFEMDFKFLPSLTRPLANRLLSILNTMKSEENRWKDVIMKWRKGRAIIIVQRHILF